MTLENTNDSAGQGDFMIFQSLQHGSDGEPWREAGGEVFEGVDHQVDPVAGEGGRQETVTQVLCSPARQHLKPPNQREPSKKITSTPKQKRGMVREEGMGTHSFLSRAFSSSLVNKLFSPICMEPDSVMFLTH